MEQPAIRHRARTGTDIVGKLRSHQDHDGRIADRRDVGAAVTAGHCACLACQVFMKAISFSWAVMTFRANFWICGSLP